MYTGQMSSKDRDATLLQFEAWEDSGGVAALLISTTCGNAGLNLTCANTCIFLDIWCVRPPVRPFVRTSSTGSAAAAVAVLFRLLV